MANWDSKFESIVRETERSLARVKSQLHSPVAVRYAYPSRARSPLKDLHRTRQPQRGVALPAEGVRAQVGVTMRVRSQPTEQQSLLVSLLSERVEEQKKETDSLQELVASLQSTVEDQSQQIRALRGEVLHLQQRLSEGGADLKTERKLEQFKTEVSQELALLRRQHQLHTSPSPSRDNTLSSITHELHSSKRLLNEEIDSLERDISLMKSRLVSQESEVAVWSSNMRELDRRQEKLTKAVSSLQDWQRSEHLLLQRERHLDSTHNHSSQLQAISSLMATLEQRLESLPQQVTSSTPSLEANPKTTKRARGAIRQRNPLHEAWNHERRLDFSDASFPSLNDTGNTLDLMSESDGEASNNLLLDDSDSLSSLSSTA